MQPDITVTKLLRRSEQLFLHLARVTAQEAGRQQISDPPHDFRAVKRLAEKIISPGGHNFVSRPGGVISRQHRQIQNPRPDGALVASNSTVNLIAAQKIAVKAARAAGRLMYANWNRPKHVKLAEAHDIKLELDTRCQRLIEKILRTAFPQIPLLGEEGDTGDVNAEYRWVVDPIDGTVNYFSGLPHAAVSIALQVRKPKSNPRGYQSVSGVIYDPFTDELWTATRGDQTRLNGKIVRVSHRSKLADAVIAIGFSKSKENLEKSLPYLIRLARRARKIRIMGSAALELAYVACGRLDAYIERTINLWDIAAGALMVECSGGEFYALPAPGGKFRMCADNGRLRKKLQPGSLLK